MVERKRKSAFFRGDAGLKRVDMEREKERVRAEARKNAKKVPFRFFVPTGETRRCVILDDKPDFFMYEHQAKGPDGHWNVFSGCVKETETCPACEALGRESYFGMYLTVLDLTPFKTRDGTKVEYSRKLLVVKSAQQKKFQRFYNKEETLRGAVFDFTRDGEKEPSIGNDIEFVEFMPEDELSEYVRTYKDKDGKKVTEDCSVPFEYEDIFDEPDADTLRAMFGGKAAPGSRKADEEELGSRRSASKARKPVDDDADGDDDDWEDAGTSDTDKKPTRSVRRTSAEDEEKEETPPRRTAARTAAKPAGKPAATRRRVDTEEEEEEEEKPTPRRVGVRRR